MSEEMEKTMEMGKNAEANKELVRNLEQELKIKNCLFDRARADLKEARKYLNVAELELKAKKDSLINTRKELERKKKSNKKTS